MTAKVNMMLTFINVRMHCLAHFRTSISCKHTHSYLLDDKQISSDLRLTRKISAAAFWKTSDVNIFCYNLDILAKAWQK